MCTDTNLLYQGRPLSIEDPKQDYITEVSGLLTRDEKDKIRHTQENLETILERHPLLQNIRTDIFSQRIVVVGPLPWCIDYSTPREWSNSDDAELQSYLAIKFHLDNPRKKDNAFNAVISRRRFHPVRSYIKSITWDGQPRIDTLFIDYLGSDDTPLNRAVTRKWLIAAVTRVFQPGCKFDNILTLIGAEGIGKSRILGYLGGAGTMQDWFTDSLASIEPKEAGETIQGKWIIEIGELSNYKKSTVEAFKAYLSRTTDRYREPFARRAQDYPRQCVFAATTNEDAPLKGDTGNRRFWLLYVGEQLPKIATAEDLKKIEGLPRDRQITILCKTVVGRVIEVRDQIWAEAYEAYTAGEDLYLPFELEEQARLSQRVANEASTDPRIGLIEAYIHALIPANWDKYTKQQRRDYFRYGTTIGTSDYKCISRKKVCVIEVINECLFGEIGQDKSQIQIRQVNALMRNCEFLKPGIDDKGRARHITFGPYGKQQPFYIVNPADDNTIL